MSKKDIRPQLTAIVNEDRISGKAPSTKDYANWFASINRLMQMALKVDDNEASKILQKHEKAVSEAWAKNMSSLDAGLFIAGEMDKAREVEQAETAKETRNILQQEADTRDKYAESKGGFDFIHEVGYSGKSVIKTYLPLPESRGLKLNGEPDVNGYRMYWATDKALEKLKQDYPNNQYGMGQQYGGKHLNKSPKLKKMGMSLAEMKALNKGMKAVPGSKKHQEAIKELSKAKAEKEFQEQAKKAKALKPVEHYENWWEKIIGHLMTDTGLSRSDAQGILQAKDFELTQQWGKKNSAANAYKEIFEKAKTKQPAVKPGLFVTLGKDKFEITSLKDASERWSEFRDSVWRDYGDWPKTMRSSADILNEKGEVVGYISQNGKIWKGKHDVFNPEDKPIYNPFEEPEAKEKLENFKKENQKRDKLHILKLRAKAIKLKYKYK